MSIGDGYEMQVRLDDMNRQLASLRVLFASYASAHLRIEAARLRLEYGGVLSLAELSDTVEKTAAMMEKAVALASSDFAEHAGIKEP